MGTLDEYAKRDASRLHRPSGALAKRELSANPSLEALEILDRGDLEGEHDPRDDRDRADRADHLPLPPTDLREPAIAYGDDIRYTADQIGHEDPRFTLRAYTQATKRRDRLTKPQRDAFDRAIEWVAMSSTGDLETEALREEATRSPL